MVAGRLTRTRTGPSLVTEQVRDLLLRLPCRWRGAGLQLAGPSGPALGVASDSGLPLELLCQRGWLSGRVTRCQRHGAGELFLSAHSSGQTLPGGYRVPRCRKCRAETDALAAEIALSGKRGRSGPRAPRSTAARRGGPTLACCRDTGENPGCAWEAGTVAWQWIRPVREKGCRDECAANE